MRGRLSRREWLVWCLWTNGATRKQVAESLGVALSTSDTYIKRLSRKLGTSGPIAASRAHVRFVRHGNLTAD